MSINVLVITHNRPRYLAISIPRILETLPDDGRLVIWDNASGAETVSYLEGIAGHPKVTKVHFNDSNIKLRTPTNWFWSNYGDADLLTKVDDDCLMPYGWYETLHTAHADEPRFGVLGCWRFLPEDFLPDIAARKIQTFGSHKVMRNCWVEGSGYVMKASMRRRLGFLKERESFTNYCTRGAAAGFINGWYFPFLFQDHFDDPRSPHTDYTSDVAFQAHRPLSAATFKIGNLDEWTRRLRHSAHSLQEYSFDPSDYVGIKAQIRRFYAKLRGCEYFPKTHR